MEATQRRESFENLGDFESASSEQSGLRRLPAQPPPLPKRDVLPSLWREVVEGAPAEDPDRTFVPEPIEVAPTERVDLDALVDDLAKRADSFAAPPAAALSQAPVALAPARGGRRLAVVAGIAGVALALYAAGFATSRVWEETSTPAPTVAPAEAPSFVAPAVEQTPTEEPRMVQLAPVIFAPVAVRAPEPRPRVAPRPDAPSRASIRRAMSAVAPRVEACASDDDAGRVARVRITFGSHGRAVHAVTSGVAGATASCIAAAARRAHVAPFARESFVVEYPFAL